MPQTHFTMWQYKLLLRSSVLIMNNSVCASSFMSFAPSGTIWLYILVAVGIYRILILWLPVRGKTSAAFSCDRSVCCEWETVLLPAIENTHKQKPFYILWTHSRSTKYLLYPVYIWRDLCIYIYTLFYLQ